jgi:hypothetical protein
MKFGIYLTEGRSQSIKYDEFVRMLPNYSDSIKSYFVKNNPPMIRGINAGGYNWAHNDHGQNDPYGAFMTIDPKKFKRRNSYGGSDFYMLLFAHHPAWKGYPDRAKSVIGSAMGGYAKGQEYAESGLYLLFPENGSTIGVCHHNDMWSSFGKTLGFPSEETLGAFVQMLTEAIRFTGVTGSIDKSWNAAHNAMIKFDKQIEQWLKDGGFEVNGDWNHINSYDDVLETFNDFLGTPMWEVFNNWWSRYYKGNLMRALGQGFDPKKHDFKILKAGDKYPLGKEMWTSGKCLMVNYNLDEFGYDIDDVRNLMIDSV